MEIEKWTPKTTSSYKPPAAPVAPGTVQPPNEDNYWFVETASGNLIPASPGTPGAFLDRIGYNKDAMTYNKYLQDTAEGADEGLASTAAAMAGVHAQNLATYADTAVAEIQAQIAAGQLRLDQAEAEFNRRMDAFEQAGTQMSNMWQWTVAPGTETVHGDIRENLGMAPWESQAVSFDPYKMAWDIVNQTPEVQVESPSMDPITAALERARQFA